MGSMDSYSLSQMDFGQLGQPKAWAVSEERLLMSGEGGRDRFFLLSKE